MATLQKIREEIERLDELMVFVPINEKCTEDYKCGYEHALEEVRNFLDTMQEKEVDLEKYYPEFLQKEWFGKSKVRTVSEMMEFTAKHFYNLGKQSSDKDCPKIKGWVARDANGSISFFLNRPHLNHKWHDTYEGEYIGDSKIITYHPYDKPQIPWLTFENSPIEVELTIKKI